MKGYWVARCHVTNSEEYLKYIELAGPIIESFGGKFLVRGGTQIEVEGGNFERTVLVEFENIEVAKKCYESDEYQSARKHTIDSSIRHIALAEGI